MSQADLAHLPLALAIWTAVWLFRRRRRDPSAFVDAACMIAAELFIICRARSSWDSAQIFCACHLSILCSLWVAQRIFYKIEPAKTFNGNSQGSGEPSKPWAKPTIIPSRTNHVRFIPKKHSFSYKYLLVGVPVGWSGRSGYWLSCDSSKKALLTVHGDDHLSRDQDGSTLRQKLDIFLESQGRDPSEYPFAYLITAPRVLGYSFNPVSFWYLYSSERRLVAMILEVNNTFDERRPYLLDATPSTEGDIKGGSPVFSSSWAKDFHVSPFNDREGSYSLSAQDLGLGTAAEVSTVSNTITLSTPNNERKLVARIFSTEKPLDPSRIGLLTAIWLIATYGWVGFVTFPRILREAWKLYFKRALDVWFRPEVNRGSTGRTPTSIERMIENLFRQYLAVQIRKSTKPISVVYKSAPGLAVQPKHLCRQMKDFPESTTDIEVEVLTPAFYSRLVHYHSVREAIREEALCTDPRNRTLFVSDPTRLSIIFDEAMNPRKPRFDDLHVLGLDRLRWEILRMLRCNPAAQSFLEAATPDDVKSTDDSKMTCFSQLDIYVAQSSIDDGLYRRSVTQLFLAQRYTAGFTGLVSFLDGMTRLALTFTGVYAASKSMTGYNSDYLKLVSTTIMPLLLLNTVHGWAFVKGLSAPTRTDSSQPVTIAAPP